MPQNVKRSGEPNKKNSASIQHRLPKRVTHDRLKRQALFYLERFNATQASLRTVLQRKVLRAARVHPETDLDQTSEWIEQIVEQCVRLGLVNDENFALSRARSLLRSGKSLRAVSLALRHKGVSDEHIRAAIERLNEEAETSDTQERGQDLLEIEAARAYVRKRRLGGMRQPASKERYDKDLAKLVRAGFGFDLSRRVLDETFET